MEFVVRHVVELSPAVEALLRLLIGSEEDRRREGVRASPPAGAPGPSPDAEAGPATPQAPPPASAEPAADVARPPGKGPAWNRDNTRSYRTDERQEVLVREWPGRLTMRALHALLIGMDGPIMPSAHACVYHWAEEIGLGKRPGRENLQRHIGAQRPNAARASIEVRRRAKADALAGGGEPEAQQDTRAGVAGVAAPVGPSTEAGGIAPVKAVEEESGAGAGVPTGALSADPPAPQPIGRPPNTGGEAGSVPAQASAAPRPPAPPEPRAPAPRLVAPALPRPSNGKHYASFREIKAWAAHYDIAYNGANIHAVNNRRKLMGLLPVVQDEDRPAADTRAA
jgi:hypothetical protein